ncbi:MAG: RNA 2',3'-cyclic phosphodiesterase [Anaerolineales bacterium]|jgi:RNA 2',3'-cyclic 3'-phosphodiesterase
MSVIRAFIAIDLSPEIRRMLEQVTMQLRERMVDVPIRWAPAQNIHLTLMFLGDVSVKNLEMLKKVLQNEVSSHHSFEFSVGGVGAFPNNRHARVVWVGVEAPAELLNVQRGIETAVSRLGYAREERPFSAHLTLGRVSRNATSKDIHLISDVLESTKVGFLGVAQVDAIHLLKSDLRPAGAVYSRVFSTPLAD